MPKFDRRSVVKAIPALAIAADVGGSLRAATRQPVFLHGVASGDPLSDSVIIWTRISGALGGNIDVQWRVALDAHFRDEVQSGLTTTGPGRDYCVHVDIKNLTPGQTYYYQFDYAGNRSPIGRTKTAARGMLEELRMAVVSCANYDAGFFNVYRAIAHVDDIDVVIHLGDYIYEYGYGEYATQEAIASGRYASPKHEVVTLEDYRLRHASYKSDQDLQALHARHPMIAVWDDHEVANNAWTNGAENHDSAEGAWNERKAAATKAYFEWMPIRRPSSPDSTQLYRAFEFGDLVHLAMLDTRHDFRDKQLDYARDNSAIARVEQERHMTNRRLTSDAQMYWLRQQLQSSKQRWNFIGQQVLMAGLKPPANLVKVAQGNKTAGRWPAEFLRTLEERGKRELPLLLDTWDGYLAQKERFLDLVTGSTKQATVVLTGDIHTAMAGMVNNARGQAIFPELVTPSVTSPSLADYISTQRPQDLEESFLEANRHMNFINSSQHGWIDVQVGRDMCLANWRFVNSVQTRNFLEISGPRLRIENCPPGQARMQALS